MFFSPAPDSTYTVFEISMFVTVQKAFRQFFTQPSLFVPILFSFYAINTCGSVFYVARNGDDSALGKSPDTAWKSIERVNKAHFGPGDRVFFEGGTEFVGNLRLTPENVSDSGEGVLFGAFGNGRAILLAGRESGVIVKNVGDVQLENLVIAGKGTNENGGCGILCENTLTNGNTLGKLNIRNVEVSGFGKQGILISGSLSGFRGIRISECEIHDNLFGGIEISGQLPWNVPGCVHSDVEVSACNAYRNTGDPACHTRHSGSGIVLMQIEGGLVDRCKAWNNGHANGSYTGGPVGIWTCASKRVTIQRCESFTNGTTRADGGGFDIDGGCEECVLQNNFSHDNDGPGLMVYTYPYECRPHRSNIVRFNVSLNDARKNPDYAGLWIKNDNDGITGLKIYNNTVCAGEWSAEAAIVYGDGLDASFRNNIFLARNRAIPLRVQHPNSKVSFQNNAYWHDGASPRVLWGEKTYTSLGEWRRDTGAEFLDGEPLGLFLNLRIELNDHTSDFRSFRSSTVHALRSLADSSVQGWGMNLREKFGEDIGAEAFIGDGPPQNGRWPLGAFSN